ncbi:MAG: hypothetical protein WD712_01070 [Candidatus Spechtbacterales bacterium]
MTSLHANTLEQFIKKSKGILIVPAKDKIKDTFPAAIALSYVCKKLGSNSGVYLLKESPEQLKFLINNKTDSSGLALVEGIIFLGSEPHDLKIDTNEMVFVKNPFRTFILNSRAAHNKSSDSPKNYILDISASSVSEILARTIKSMDEELITREMATALLTGLIASTQNFRLAVRPQTLFIAAYLISKGADNEKIAKQLYKTRPLNSVKLWGHALSRFSYDNNKKIGWSFIKKDDLKNKNENRSQISFILNEFKNNFTEANIFVLGISHFDYYLAVVHAKNDDYLKTFARKHKLSIKNSSVLVRASKNGNPESLTQKIVEALKKTL